MFSVFWLSLLIFCILIYTVRSFRRLIIFICGWTLGHAWLGYRRLTANTQTRLEKRAYLEQNPDTKAYYLKLAQKEAEEEAERRKRKAQLAEFNAATSALLSPKSTTKSIAPAASSSTHPTRRHTSITPSNRTSSPPTKPLTTWMNQNRLSDKLSQVEDAALTMAGEAESFLEAAIRLKEEQKRQSQSKSWF